MVVRRFETKGTLKYRQKLCMNINYDAKSLDFIARIEVYATRRHCIYYLKYEKQRT